MTTVFEKVSDALDTLNPTIPYALGQYLTSTGGDLPDVFIVYSEISGVPVQHADNVEKQRTFRIQLSLYSRTGLISLPDVDTAMIAQGFTRGPERQLPYDEGTRHFGLAKDYFYLQ